MDGQPLSLSFRGKRGQLVGYSRPGDSGERVELRTQGRTKSLPGMGHGDARVWRLPRSGRFTFHATVRRSETTTQPLQLVRIRTVRIPLDAPCVTVKVGRAYIDAAAVRTTLSDRIAVRSRRSTRAWSLVVTPTWLAVGRVHLSPTLLPVDGVLRDGAWASGFGKGWVVRTTGRHELRITPGLSSAPKPSTAIQVRRARRIADLVAGTTGTFVAQQPGQWVAAEFVLPPGQGTSQNFVASAAAMSGGWTADGRR